MFPSIAKLILLLQKFAAKLTPDGELPFMSAEERVGFRSEVVDTLTDDPAAATAILDIVGDIGGGGAVDAEPWDLTTRTNSNKFADTVYNEKRRYGAGFVFRYRSAFATLSVTTNASYVDMYNLFESNSSIAVLVDGSLLLFVNNSRRVFLPGSGNRVVTFVEGYKQPGAEGLTTLSHQVLDLEWSPGSTTTLIPPPLYARRIVFNTTSIGVGVGTTVPPTDAYLILLRKQFPTVNMASQGQGGKALTAHFATPELREVEANLTVAFLNDAGTKECWVELGANDDLSQNGNNLALSMQILAAYLDLLHSKDPDIKIYLQTRLQPGPYTLPTIALGDTRPWVVPVDASYFIPGFFDLHPDTRQNEIYARQITKVLQGVRNTDRLLAPVTMNELDPRVKLTGENWEEQKESFFNENGSFFNYVPGVAVTLGKCRFQKVGIRYQARPDSPATVQVEVDGQIVDTFSMVGGFEIVWHDYDAGSVGDHDSVRFIHAGTVGTRFQIDGVRLS